ncbi:PDZ domain-containing protein [bacterium]|nr:PDZ domain-containing protein [bacterium]
MKRYFIVLFLFLAFSMISYSTENSKKVVVAVIDIKAKAGISDDLASTISDYLRTKLLNTNRYIMVTRANMTEILKEQNFQQSGCTTQECAVQMGKLLGVSKIFTGSLGGVGSIFLINIKMLNIETGQIEKAESMQAASEEDLLKAINKITSLLTGVKLTKQEKVIRGSNTPSPRSRRANNRRQPTKIRKIDASQALTKNELLYAENETRPFTGMMIYKYGTGSINAKANFHKGKMSGKYMKYDIDGKLDFTGNYEYGKKTGNFIWYYKSGKVKTNANYESDVLSGLMTSYYENGKTRSTVNYVNDKENGEYKFYDEDSALRYKRNYKNGLYEGEYSEYYGNGNIKEIDRYKNGKKNGVQIYYRKGGKKKSEINYKNGKKDGKNIQYFENGKVKSIIYYIDGKKNGTVELYNEKGKLEEKGNYLNDKLSGEYIRYYGKNKPRLAYNYKKGKKNDAVTSYNKNGNIRYKANFINDRITGDISFYDKKGNLNKTLKKGDGYLGIYYKQLYDNLKKKGLMGVVIEGVQKDSAASLAGLKIRDIITMIDDKTINDDIDFNVYMAIHRSSDKIKLNILRDDERLIIPIILGKR